MATKTFKANGDYGAIYEAREWLSENGFSFGSVGRAGRMGIMKGDWDTEKWKNASASDIRSMDGLMIFNSDMSCTICIKTELMPK